MYSPSRREAHENRGTEHMSETISSNFTVV